MGSFFGPRFGVTLQSARDVLLKGLGRAFREARELVGDTHYGQSLRKLGPASQ